MTRAQGVALVAGLVGLFAVASIIGVGEAARPPGSPASTTAPSSAWAELGLGALVGALVGVVGTHLLHERREQKRNLKERDALWILVRTEILLNSVALESLRYHPEGLLSQPLAAPPLSVQTWQETRVRLAQLMPWEYFYELVNYYINLQILLQAAATLQSEDGAQGYLSHIVSLSEKTGDVIYHLDTLTGERDWGE